jgi:hypothetical protein
MSNTRQYTLLVIAVTLMGFAGALESGEPAFKQYPADLLTGSYFLKTPCPITRMWLPPGTRKAAAGSAWLLISQQDALQKSKSSKAPVQKSWMTASPPLCCSGEPNHTGLIMPFYNLDFPARVSEQAVTSRGNRVTLITVVSPTRA